MRIIDLRSNSLPSLGGLLFFIFFYCYAYFELSRIFQIVMLFSIKNKNPASMVKTLNPYHYRILIELLNITTIFYLIQEKDIQHITYYIQNKQRADWKFPLFQSSPSFVFLFVYFYVYIFIFNLAKNWFMKNPSLKRDSSRC